MQFIDFEVFRYDWLCVIINPEVDDEIVIVNDRDALINYYQKNINDIWIGFNIRHYDQYIFKAILLGLDPKEVNDFIIIQDHAGWEFDSRFREVPLNFYDVMNTGDKGLKYYEGSMGNDIRESSVSFDTPLRLTQAQIDETVKYCTHDVEQTMEVFSRRIVEFNAHVGILKVFNLPLSDMGKTKVQLAAKILDARKRSYHDEFDIDVPSTLSVKRYTEVVDWYRNSDNYDYTKSLDIIIAGVPHTFKWGGAHGAIPNYVSEGNFINMDVSSLYPSIMIRYNLISRSCHAEKFKDLVTMRLKYKAEKNPLELPLKRLINGTYGASRDKKNPLYDPRQGNRVCIYGQLLLLDLIEHLEDAGAEIIQSNTDGVLVKMPDDYQGGIDKFYSDIDDVAHEWEDRTGLNLEFDEYCKVFQGDVNNYLIVAEDGHYKGKGSYVKKLSDLDYDLAIINEAIVENLLNRTPIAKTIYNCNDLYKFQLVKRISAKYEGLIYNGKMLNEKTVRVFASIRREDTTLYKRHKNGRTQKVEGTPEHCFIVNENVNDMPIPSILDKRWYIAEAERRIVKFKNEDRRLF